MGRKTSKSLSAGDSENQTPPPSLNMNSNNKDVENLAEMVELAAHPYFVACQFHPEFKSKPLHPHPLFTAFVKAALEHEAKKSQKGNTTKKGVVGGEVAEA